ncbi:MAG TPA: hypothetical protein VGK90_12280 [Rhizomicrobium sp.]|jgi:hypothetical protein
MARLSAVEFENFRDPRGYRLVWRNTRGQELREPNRPGSYYVARRTPYRCEREEDFIKPLKDGLYAAFAGRTLTPENVLEFVTQNGALTPSGFDPDKGDHVEMIIMHARWMADLINRPDSRRVSSGTQRILSRIPDASLEATIEWDAARQNYKWVLRPRTLLDGLWLQFGQSITRGTIIRSCPQCGDFFECGPGTDRQAHAKFCSEEHKTRFFSLKRSKRGK